MRAAHSRPCPSSSDTHVTLGRIRMPWIAVHRVLGRMAGACTWDSFYSFPASFRTLSAAYNVWQRAGVALRACAII